MYPISLCLLMAGVFCCSQKTWAEEEDVPLESVPPAVMQTLKVKYPQAKITEAEKETEGGQTVYDVTVIDDGQEIEVSLKPDGTILELEEADHKDDESANELDDDDQADEDDWTSSFAVDKEDLMSSGRNPFFVLEPGYQSVLEGGDDRLVITVLNETKMVDGVETRIIEERESEGGHLVEVSRNFFAISRRTNAVFYFGEEVDIYKADKIVTHEGAWLAGEKNAKFGLIMPGLPLLGARYYQEFAEGEAMDRAEIDDLDETLVTPAGEFKHCLKIEETTPLEPDTREYKLYAPGVGLIQEESLKLVKYGKVDLPRKP